MLAFRQAPPSSLGMRLAHMLNIRFDGEVSKWTLNGHNNMIIHEPLWQGLQLVMTGDDHLLLQDLSQSHSDVPGLC